MVAHKASKRSSVVNTFDSIYVLISLFFVLTATIAICSMFLIRELTSEQPSEGEDTSIVPAPEPEPEPAPVLPDAINFQSTIDNFVNSTRGSRSVIVYDVERDELAGVYNPAENYNTASLYKLFVVYEGYKRIQNGTWDPNTIIGYQGKTILECLDLSIRESYSPCAEPLWNLIGRDELDNIIANEYGIVNSDISSLTSNANDILSIMKLFYNHPDFTREDLVSRMKDSFLNQPVTTYNWRQGLPSGFSRANVYDKVGWDYNPDGGYWNIYHDAAIVEFPEQNRHFIVVVMTNRVPFQKIKEFGTNLESFYFTTL